MVFELFYAKLYLLWSEVIAEKRDLFVYDVDHLSGEPSAIDGL